jgi:peptidylprolyl isomerase
MKFARIVFSATLLITLSLPIGSASRTYADPRDEPGARQVKPRRHRVRYRTKRRKEVIVPITSPATTTASGLTYVITQHGSGRQPAAGETVIVNYTGLLGSGLKFDSSLDHGSPFEFPLGAGRVIKGWDEGIAKLHVGDQATLIIPPELGYGSRGAGGVIPPNATLLFLVELVGIKEAPGSK